MFLVTFAYISLVGTVLAAYPYYPYQQVLPHQVHQPPSYLVYPNGVYKLTNFTAVNNNSYQIKGNDFVFGAKSPRDALLLHTTVFKRPGIWSSVATKEITFPPPGSHMRVNITQVNAYDKGKNGTGGFVKMVGGGIGKGNVTLLFRSQRNRPIHYEVDIYGVANR